MVYLLLFLVTNMLFFNYLCQQMIKMNDLTETNLKYTYYYILFACSSVVLTTCVLLKYWSLLEPCWLFAFIHIHMNIFEENSKSNYQYSHNNVLKFYRDLLVPTVVWLLRSVYLTLMYMRHRRIMMILKHILACTLTHTHTHKTPNLLESQKEI